MKKYFSHSEFYTWNKSREEYIRQYVNGEEMATNQQMILGQIVHKTLEDKRFEWLKELKINKLENKRKVIRKVLDKAETKRPKESEVVMTAKTKDGLGLIGIFDGFDREMGALTEFKTTDNAERWNQYLVDINTQLSFYAWIYWLNFHDYFREIRLYAIDVAKGNIETFKTARSKRDIWDIEQRVNKAVGEIKRAGLWEKRLTREERSKQKLFL
jgi:hypothetical protein